MKRSDINAVIREAADAFRRHHWALPPHPRWDVTDFGLGDFDAFGLTLVNLAEQPEYCEKLMYVRPGQVTPRHYHNAKKEDIICRWGRLAIQLHGDEAPLPKLQVNGVEQAVPLDEPLVLEAGWRITLPPGVPHTFWADADYAIVGEVSTANDDLHDNVFHDTRIGRFSEIDEDEPPLVRLVSD